jgi:ubiquinone/menaquinone biosynthesis C-methylase UbiE
MEYKEIIKKSYDELNIAYQDNYSENKNTYAALNIFNNFVKEHSKIVDLGCGTGIPAGKYLSEKGHTVTGVDISSEMTKLFEKNVPKMKSICCDFSSIPVPDSSFDAGVALFSLLHVAKKDMDFVLKEFHRIIRKEGILLLCVNKGDFEGYSELLGKKMFFTCFEESELDTYLKNSGFTIVIKYFDNFVIQEEIEEQMFYMVKKL